MNEKERRAKVVKEIRMAAKGYECLMEEHPELYAVAGVMNVLATTLEQGHEEELRKVVIEFVRNKMDELINKHNLGDSLD